MFFQISGSFKFVLDVIESIDVISYLKSYLSTSVSFLLTKYDAPIVAPNKFFSTPILIFLVDNNNYKTSISVEPFLSNPLNFINYLEPFVTESIWIGPMNYIKINNIKPNEIEFYNKIRSLYSPFSLYSLYNQLRKIVKIRIKDSFLIKLYNAGLILDFENLLGKFDLLQKKC